uniref:Beta-lactamase-related domain-containing protein n=1 Tax=Ditylenchus dipsaci TaxID=166011 RepID=A0A915DV81_9BILA
MVTVEDLINHKAGLIGFCKPIELDQANDLDLISSIIEESVPYWEPCTGNGYHAVTYGFLLDQLVRRVDEKGRTVAQYHKEEVLSNDSTEFFIGLPGEKFHQVARITNPTRYENILALLNHPLTFIVTLFKQLTGQLKLLNISAFSIPYLAVLGCGDMKYNNPRVLRTANMACTGVATARGVAQAAMDFFKGDVLSPAVKTAIAAPTEDEADVLMKWKLNRGHGFIYSPHPTIQGKWLLLAMGYGGQFFEMDTDHNICIAMVRNGLRTEMVYKILMPTPLWGADSPVKHFGTKIRVIVNKSRIKKIEITQKRKETSIKSRNIMITSFDGDRKNSAKYKSLIDDFIAKCFNNLLGADPSSICGCLEESSYCYSDLFRVHCA